MVTRADEACAGDITVTGLEPGTITWTVKTPDDQSLLRYLSCTDCANPTFTPDENTPATIIYEVCGRLAGTYVCDGVPIEDCAEVKVTTLAPIRINFDQTIPIFCENEIPVINAEITPTNLTYNYTWYDGPDGTGSIISTSPAFQPPGPGTYSLIVEETSTGIGCNTASTNYTVEYDLAGPTLLVPPEPLVLECNDPDAETIIQAWLNTAYAEEEDGSTRAVTNDYAPFDQSCGLIQPITFTTVDTCGNASTGIVNITIEDNTPPAITPAADASSDCSTPIPGNDPGFIAWLANHGGATATDECDNDLVWTDNSATQTWGGHTGQQANHCYIYSYR